MPAFAEGVDEIADLVEELVASGSAATAIALSEHALARLEKALESADDSDGQIGDLLGRFQQIHLDACRAIPRTPSRSTSARSSGYCG